MEKKELKRYLTIGFIVVGICVIVKNLSFIGEIVSIALTAVSPLLVGCAIAYVFNIFLSFCEKYYFPKSKNNFIVYSRRPVCLVLALAITITLITLILNVVIPELITALKLLTAEIPKMAIKIKDLVIKLLEDYPEIQKRVSKIEIDWSSIDWESISTKAYDILTTGATELLGSIATFIAAFTMSVTNIIISIIFAIYILLRKERISMDLKRSKRVFFSEKANKYISKVLHTANETFRSFFVGQFVEAIILGMLCAIGMTILKLPYAAMTGTVIGVTALIPIVGAYIGGAVGAFMICTVDPFKALIFVVFLLLLQQFEGNVIYPKVVGTSIGLPGIWVLAAVTIGGGLFGILGMLLGVPTFATAYKLYHENLKEREVKLGIVVDVPEPEKSQPKEKQPKTKEKFSFFSKKENKKK